MTLPSTTVSRRFRIALILVVVLIAILIVMSWPRMFVSEARELTGSVIDLQQLTHFERPSREGFSATIFRIPDASAQLLESNVDSLRGYPMWCALAFDGYKRVRWQPLNELVRGPDRILADAAFREGAIQLDPSAVRTTDDAREFAAALARQYGVYVAAWYRERDGVVTRYFAYVLDIKRRLLVKVSLIT
jgi:hypothetical protein